MTKEKLPPITYFEPNTLMEMVLEVDTLTLLIRFNGGRFIVEQKEYMEIADNVFLKCKRWKNEPEDEYLYRWQQETQKELIAEIVYKWIRNDYI